MYVDFEIKQNTAIHLEKRLYIPFLLIPRDTLEKRAKLEYQEMAE